MSEIVTRLRERRAQVWEQAKEIADRASEEGRSFNGQEEEQWQKLNAELDALDKRVQNVIDGEQRAKETEEAFSKLEGKPVTQRGSNAQTPGGGGTNEELRKFLRGEGPRFYEVRSDKPVNFRALSVGAATGGGDTVPTSFYDRLVQHLIVNAAIMQAGVTVIQTNGGETIQVPKTTAHSSAARISEGSAIPEADPSFGQVPLNAYKYGALIQISRELLDDTGVDLEGYLAMEAGRALGNLFGQDAIVGDGTQKPRGVVTDATVGITGGTALAGSFTADNLIDLHYSVIAPYRKSPACHWMMQDVTVGQVRKLKDNYGQYLWQPGMQIGAPDLLLGKPVLTDPNVAAVATSAKSVLFGDFSRYFVRLAGALRFERSDDYAFNTDLVTFRALMRADAALVDLTGAVKTFTGNAA